MFIEYYYKTDQPSLLYVLENLRYLRLLRSGSAQRLKAQNSWRDNSSPWIKQPTEQRCCWTIVSLSWKKRIRNSPKQGCNVLNPHPEYVLYNMFGWNSPSKSNGQSSAHRRSHKSTESEYGHYGGPEECEHLRGDFSVVALSPCLINEVLDSLRGITQVERLNRIWHERKGCFNLNNRNINKSRTPRHTLSSFIFHRRKQF